MKMYWIISFGKKSKHVLPKFKCLSSTSLIPTTCNMIKIKEIGRSICNFPLFTFIMNYVL